MIPYEKRKNSNRNEESSNSLGLKRQRLEDIFQCTASQISNELSKLDDIARLKETEENSDELQNQAIIKGMIEQSEAIFPYVIEYLKHSSQDETLREGAVEMLHIFSAINGFAPRLVAELNVLSSLFFSTLKNDKEISLNLSALKALYNFAGFDQFISVFNHRENEAITMLLAFRYYMKEDAFEQISFILSHVSFYKIYAEILLEEISTIITLANSYNRISTNEDIIKTTKNLAVVFENLSASDKGKTQILGNTMVMMWLYQQREFLEKSTKNASSEKLLYETIKKCEKKVLKDISGDIATYTGNSHTLFLDENNSFMPITTPNDSFDYS